MSGKFDLPCEPDSASVRLLEHDPEALRPDIARRDHKFAVGQRAKEPRYVGKNGPISRKRSIGIA